MSRPSSPDRSMTACPLRRAADTTFRRACALAVLLLAGCAAPPPPELPVTLTDYSACSSRNEGWPDRTVTLQNLSRVMDASLPESQRLESLRVVDKVDGASLEVHASLVSLAQRDECPEDLRSAVQAMLRRRGWKVPPRLTTRPAPRLETVSAETEQPDTRPSAVTSESVQPVAMTESSSSKDGPLVMATSIPAEPDVQPLAELIKDWGLESVPIPPDREADYRQQVESAAGMPWADALVEALNEPSFMARGSALEILAERLPGDQLRQRLLSVTANTDAVSAMQYYIRRLDYLPVQRHELLTSVVTHLSKRSQLDAAAELAARWRAETNYVFNIRDFHLLSRLGSNHTRELPNRSDLITLLATAVGTHLHYHRPGGEAAYPIGFSEQVGRLTMADLANLYLINEMLGRPQVRAAIRVMAEKDRRDVSSQWGGLVFYNDGLAEARLYPADPRSTDNTYLATSRLMQDASDALLLLHGHFGALENSEQVGPDASDLDIARQLNIYGLILTSLDENTFNAMYYNPDGIAVSLGNFEYGEQQANSPSDIIGP